MTPEAHYFRVLVIRGSERIYVYFYAHEIRTASFDNVAVEAGRVLGRDFIPIFFRGTLHGS